MTLLLLTSAILVGIAVVLLSVRLIIKKDGRFPNTHVGGQKAMRERGIACHTSQHRDAQRHRSLKERIALEEADN